MRIWKSYLVEKESEMGEKDTVRSEVLLGSQTGLQSRKCLLIML